MLLARINSLRAEVWLSVRKAHAGLRFELFRMGFGVVVARGWPAVRKAWAVSSSARRRCPSVKASSSLRSASRNFCGVWGHRGGMDYRREAVVLLPNFTRQQHATVLHALTRMTGLAESALMAAFIDADVQRVAVLDPMPARTCSPEPPAGRITR